MEDADARSRAADRERQVRGARTARHRRYADLQVEEAMRRGAFDALPGAGKPLDLGDRHDPHWWVKRLIARERIEGTTPPAIALRLEDERLDATLDEETTEREVLRRLEDFNRRVREARRQLAGGPPVITPLRDADVELQRWRERRESRRAVAEAERAARAAQEQARRRHRPRWRRRRGATSEETGSSRTVVAAVAAVTVAAVIGGVAVVRAGDQAPDATAPARLPASSPDPTPAATTPAEPTATQAAAPEAPCTTSERPFRPTSVTIPGVRRDIEVVRPPRDGNGIPGTPPLTSDGKIQMAYDTAQGIAPGAEAGNALFNAHTWPDGSALGNELLQGLQEGDVIRVAGRGGRQLCYELVRRVKVPATVSGKQYYRRDGAPRMAIVVCSGVRGAGGDWSHRTLFFAAPRA